MSGNDVRASITQAKFNESNSGCLFGQVFVVAIGLGVASGSWWVFGTALVGLIIALFIKRLAALICVAFALGWGYIGYVIGIEFIESNEAGIVIGILSFLVGLGTNLSGVQWSQDLTGVNEHDDDYEEDDKYDYNDKNGNDNHATHDNNTVSAFCHKCGNKVADGAFCSKCGTKLIRAK